ncbi:MAG: UbiX family flavin prenyltransferase [Anaerostipes sp.]|jgi:polyprenyl P-hydroxybenzoate/phenylacrylic acid decarboxylase-like protein|nr:UbiX family flavin prenyltransferase [Anaerostipes sp.]MDD3746089.1 UbiX family flavin prenyltransferase [Anaerostipes sp.]
MDLVIGISGASGVIYGVRLLEVLKQFEDVKTHVILSEYAYKNLAIETDYTVEQVEALADVWYDNHDLAASVSSGSFPIDGVIILPCSMKTLSSVANGYSDCLMVRVCDVALKEQRKLVMCPRETPLSAIHLENMLKLSRLGVSMIPPMPAFYNHPKDLDDMIHHHIMKVLDQLGLSYEGGKRWKK